MATKQSQKEDSAAKASGKKGGGGGGVSATPNEPDWFDSVTGTNDFERQSWRDNFNGGKAAGDFTGNVNAQLDRERSENFGATVSGSSTQYSAAELQAFVQSLPNSVQAEIRGGTPGLPQQTVAANASSVQAPMRSSGLAQSVMQGAFGNTVAPELMDLALGGADWRANPFWSNAEDVETRHGDVGSAIYAPFSIGADLGHNAARMYFGENYMSLKPQQRLGILGNHAQQAVKAGAQSAENAFLQSFFGGMSAIEDWGRRNRAAELAGQQAAQESAAAWDLRVQLMEEEEQRRNEPKWSGNVVAAPVHW